MAYMMLLLPLFSAAVSLVLAQPPNIIVILADDLGYNDVSWHNDVVITPHLAQLAREGVTLEQHYTQSVCSPTRGALLTGRYPVHNGLLYNGVIQPLTPYGMDTSFTTLPEELRRANYTTHIVGKWHLGFCNEKFRPTSRGFDHHYGFMCGGGDYFSHQEGRYGGYDFWDDEKAALTDNGTYSTTLIQQRAVEVISAHDDSKPLFMYIPFQAVHSPLQVPDVYKNMYSGVEDEDRRTYLGMVTAMDDAVGNITTALKLSNLYDNSVIVWLSDNGGSIQGWPPLQNGYGASNWPLRGSKLTMFEGGTRTVAFAHAPQYLSPRISTSWMHVSDWFPTLLSIAGLSPTTPDLDGLDQWANLQDASLDSPRKEMLYNIRYLDNPEFNLTGGPPISAIRVGDWKYIHRTVGFSGWAEAPESGGNVQSPGIKDTRNVLFNLAIDPEEKENLFDVEPEIAADIQAKLNKYIEDLPNEFYPPNEPAGRPENFGGIWSSGWC